MFSVLKDRQPVNFKIKLHILNFLGIKIVSSGVAGHGSSLPQGTAVERLVIVLCSGVLFNFVVISFK